MVLYVNTKGKSDPSSNDLSPPLSVCPAFQPSSALQTDSLVSYMHRTPVHAACLSDSISLIPHHYKLTHYRPSQSLSCDNNLLLWVWSAFQPQQPMYPSHSPRSSGRSWDHQESQREARDRGKDMGPRALKEITCQGQSHGLVVGALAVHFPAPT